MTTNMTRRSVALAGPAALALGTIGPVATLATLGSISTQANALTYDGSIYWLNDFFDFYEKQFKAFAAKLTRRAIAYQYTLAYLAGNANVVPGSAQWFSVYESFAIKALDASVAGSYYNSLSATAKEETHDRSRTWLNDTTPDSRLNLPASPYTTLSLHNWINLVKSLTQDQVGQMKWQDMRNWHKLVYFTKAVASDADYATLAQKSTAVETDENQRFLKGTVADSLKEEKPYLYGTSWWVMSWGNARKPVERAELVNTRSWFQTLFFYSPVYTPTSEIQHGINTTTIEPPIRASVLKNGETSTAYALAEDQTQGIDYYVNKDIADNGPYPNATVDQSRRMLRQATIFVSKETGLVFESYLYAQYVVRAAQQYTVATIRHFLTKDRYLDLAKMQSGIKLHVEGNWFYRWTHTTPKAALGIALALLTAEMISTIVLSAMALHDSRAAVAENKGKGTTVVQDASKAQNKLITRGVIANSVVALNAIGFLATAGFSTSASSNIIAQVALAGAAPAFAVSDLSNGITAITEVLKTGSENTTTGKIKIAAGVARISGAAFVFLDLGIKIYNRTYTSYFATWTVTPLSYNTVTATVAASLYLSLAIINNN